MSKFRALFKRNKIWRFSGGIHPPEMKSQSNSSPLQRMIIPELLVVPLKQHAGPAGDLRVNVGDYVLKGEPLTNGDGRALPVHAPTSGLISAIESRPIAHPSGLSELCVCIIPDGQDRWCELISIADYYQHSPQALINNIQQAGIAGLGGAVFPTAVKISSGLDQIELLIINGAECEPYISADDRLMQEHAPEIIRGCDILKHILSPGQIIIAIEDNKPLAIKAIKQALISEESDVTLRIIPTKYPSGGAKQLTKILTGREVPHGHHSADIGVLMQNVATVFAIEQAITQGKPLIERVVTCTGDALCNKGNYWVLLGTPVKHILNQCQQSTKARTTQQTTVIMGGPLMGFTLPHHDIPATKITNCILVPAEQEIAFDLLEQSCIRCGACADICPAGLLPQQLYWYSQGKEHEKAIKHHIFDCIECGACAYVCPSNIPLVRYYRQEKAIIRELRQQEKRSKEAKERYEVKRQRVMTEKTARKQRHMQAAQEVKSKDKEAIQAALERIKAKRKAAAELKVMPVNSTELPDNSAVITARQAKKEQLLLATAEQNNDNAVSYFTPTKSLIIKQLQPIQQKQNAVTAQTHKINNTINPSRKIDIDKTTVTKALACKKAKKALMQNADNQSEQDQQQPVETDPRKATVAEAIARAKAKKAAQKQSQDNSPQEE